MPSRPKHPAQPLALDVGSPRAAQAAGRGYHDFFASVRGSPHPTGLPGWPARTTHARPRTGGTPDYGAGTLVRSGDLKEKKVKWKRAEGVEGPSPRPGPRAVFGCNGRALMGRKGPYLLLGEMLIPGFNRPVQSQAVNWATAGLLADPGGAGRRSQRPDSEGGSSRRPHRGSIPSSACPPFGRRLCVHHGCKCVSVHAHWHREGL
jgi:hypothetical protein